MQKPVHQPGHAVTVALREGAVPCCCHEVVLPRHLAGDILRFGIVRLACLGLLRLVVVALESGKGAVLNLVSDATSPFITMKEAKSAKLTNRLVTVRHLLVIRLSQPGVQPKTLGMVVELNTNSPFLRTRSRSAGSPGRGPATAIVPGIGAPPP